MRLAAILISTILLAGCGRAPTEIQGIAYHEPDTILPPRSAQTTPPTLSLPDRPPTAPYFAPGLDGSHHVPSPLKFWWALADDPDGDTLLYTITTRVGDDEPILQCADLLFPPCELHLAMGRAHVVTVTANDGHATTAANVTLTARPPIVLLPDLDGNATRWDVIAARLEQDAYDVLDFRGLTDHTLLQLAPVPNESLAHFATERIAPLIQSALAANAYPPDQRVDVIAIGTGGLVARILHEEQGWMEQSVYADTHWNRAIHHAILIGTPNRGADLPCDARACLDAKPNSTLLRRLAHDDPPPDTWTISLDADPHIQADAMRIHRTPDTRIEGAGRDEAPYREDAYDAILRALAMRRGG